MSGPGPVYRTALHVLLWGNALIMLYPVFVMAVSAFKPTSAIFANPFGLADPAHIDNFAKVLGETAFLTYLTNSILVTASAIALMLLLGLMAGYAIARYDFPGNAALFLFFLSGLIVPLKLAIIPLFIQLKTLGLLDSRIGLILVYAAMGLPSTVFILTGFLRTLPRELEEAARIDGASELRTMATVMVPLTKPAIVIAAIHNAVPVWNDFFFPLVFVHTDARKTLPQGLTTFVGEFSTDWGAVFAGLTLAALPITAVYILLSKQFIAGMTSGAIK